LLEEPLYAPPLLVEPVSPNNISIFALAGIEVDMIFGRKSSELDIAIRTIIMQAALADGSSESVDNSSFGASVTI